MAFKTILKSGLQANYNAIETKDADVLYFCTDTQKIYKGDVDYTNSVVPVSTKPTNPAAGKVYVIEDTDTVEAYINDEWVVLSYPTATSVDENSDDLHVVTAKAVSDAISAFADSSETLKGILIPFVRNSFIEKMIANGVNKIDIHLLKDISPKKQIKEIKEKKEHNNNDDNK